MNRLFKILNSDGAYVLYLILNVVYMRFCFVDEFGRPSPIWNMFWFMNNSWFMLFLLFRQKKTMVKKYSKRIIWMVIIYTFAIITIFLIAMFVPGFENSNYHKWLNSANIGIILSTIILILFLRNAFIENKQVINNFKSKRNE